MGLALSKVKNHQNKTCVFLIEKTSSDTHMMLSEFRSLSAHAVMKPRRLAKDGLPRLPIKMSQFRVERQKVQVSSFQKSGKTMDLQWRLPAADPISPIPPKQPQTDSPDPENTGSSVRRAYPVFFAAHPLLQPASL